MAKILLFDIENTPILNYAWGLHQEVHSTDFVVADWYILCWSAKWLGDKKMLRGSLIESDTYQPYEGNDKELCQKLWDLLDEAEIVIAHNAIQFDVKKANARFLIHGMPPPSPYKIVDTLKIARRYFRFTSNKLGDLGVYLGCGEKLPTGGFSLWKKCMAGCLKAWKKMIKYCDGDVILLEKVYLKVRPYIKNHPNVDITKRVCPKCGSKKLKSNGLRYLTSIIKRQLVCLNCGGFSTEKVRNYTKDEKVALQNG